ncbi:MAG TPA: cytochrome c [Acetobacteraceae bacterium]|nr:cytochrome c [Acetobacteraceae bacterium]
MGLVVLNGFIFIGSGAYNVAATEPHWPLTHWIVRMIKLRSVRAHAAGISAPSSLDDDDKVTEGIVHFAAHCVICHGAPGVPNRGFGRKLYPDPPDLAGVSETYGPGELFWIVKNGIKATGMPAWNDHSDEELWAIIAFLRMLPAMSPQAYASLLTASTTRADHHHHADAVQCGNVPSTPSSSF